MKYKLFFFLLLCPLLSWANPVDSLLERLDKGASSKFELIVDGAIDNTDDYFELSDSHGKVRVRGNNYVSIATGIGWYLRYWAGIDVAWNNMHPWLPVGCRKWEPPCATRRRLRGDITSTTVRCPTRWLFGTGTAGRKRSTGWHFTASTFALATWGPTPFGTHCCNGWATAGRRHGSSLPVLPSRHGG